MPDSSYFPSKILRIGLQKRILLSLVQGLMICAVSYLLTACQSSTTSKKTSHSSGERPLILLNHHDGLQNIPWKIMQIQGRSAQFFQHVPYLFLDAQTFRVQGHTGCNQLSGQYRLHASQLSLVAQAGHQSCDGALVQEAYLMEALFEIKRYQVVGKRLELLDQSGKIILVAQK